jgi:hypothetical protein
MMRKLILFFYLLHLPLVAMGQSEVTCAPAASLDGKVDSDKNMLNKTPEPQLISSANLNDSLRQVYEAIQVGPPAEFVVNGPTPFDGLVLVAKVITFAPGGSLILGGRFSERGEKYLVARTIVILPGTPAPKDCLAHR